MYQVSTRSEYAFAFYGQSCKVYANENEEKRRNQNKILYVRMLGLVGAICFKFGMHISLAEGISAANLVEFR